MNREFHYVIYPIELEGSPVGRLAVLSDNQAMYTKMRRYMVLQIGVTVLILLRPAAAVLLALAIDFHQPLRNWCRACATSAAVGLQHHAAHRPYRRIWRALPGF